MLRRDRVSWHAFARAGRSRPRSGSVRSLCGRALAVGSSVMMPGSRESRTLCFRAASLRYSSTDAFGTVVGVADRFPRATRPSGAPKSSVIKQGIVARRAISGSSVGEYLAFGNTNSVMTAREWSIGCARRARACAANPSSGAERKDSGDVARRIGRCRMPTVVRRVPRKAIKIGAEYGWMQ